MPKVKKAESSESPVEAPKVEETKPEETKVHVPRRPGN